MRHVWRHTAIGAGLLVAAVAAGCAAPRAGSGPHPVWPPPPAQPRVVHRQTLRGASDFGPPGLLERLGAVLAGPSRQRLLRPTAASAGPRGRLYVSDQERQGVHVFRVGSASARFIDRVGDVFFVSPAGVAAVGERVAVADSALRRVDLLEPDGDAVLRYEKPGGFARPAGLAYDANHGELYVVDAAAHEVCVFDGRGAMVRRFGEPGADIGQFNFPTHVFVDDAGRVFVTDSLNFRVQVFDRRGRYLFEIGRHGDASGHFGVPKGVVADRFGHVYVTDSYFSNVQVFDTAGRFLLAIGGPGEGAGRFQIPTGLAIDDRGTIYVCDSHNRRLQALQYVGGDDDAKP